MTDVVIHWADFLSVSILVIVTPGPDTALTIRNTLIGGRRSGTLTAVGIAAGQATWTRATSAGVAALLVASGPAFAAVKLAGAAYLVFLGAQALRGALRSRETAGAVAAPVGPRVAPIGALRQGVISNLGNPKMAVFFTSLLPQVIVGHISFFALLLLGLIFCALTLAWLTLYAIVVSTAGDVLRRPSIRRSLEGLTGIVLMGLGLRLALEPR